MKALIIVDVQNDFCPGGALAVEGGDKIIAVINTLQLEFDLVVATQDWHPGDHKSFAGNHPGKKAGDMIPLEGLTPVLWPDHCVQGTVGAELCADLNKNKIKTIIQKGTDPGIDSYSGFFDNEHRKSTGLDEFLRKHGVDEVGICGLATDYCVKFTALDAVSLAYKTSVILNACRGVDLCPGDVQQAIEEMRNAGVLIR